MGEQQCLGILRAIYHKPRWAVLDEATSAMPEDVAVESYKLLQSRSINFVSVSQSVAAMRPFHGQELRLGEPNANGYVIDRLEDDSEAFAKGSSDVGTDDTSGTGGTFLDAKEEMALLTETGSRLFEAMQGVLLAMGSAQMELPADAAFAGVRDLLAKGERLSQKETAAIVDEIENLDRKGSAEHDAGDLNWAFATTARLDTWRQCLTMHEAAATQSPRKPTGQAAGGLPLELMEDGV